MRQAIEKWWKQIDEWQAQDCLAVRTRQDG